MFKSYCLTAYRYLTRQMSYTLLNITGLSFGMICFLLIALYVVDEWSFDTFNANSDHIYRVIENKTAEGKESKVAEVAYQLSERAQKDIPELVNSSRVFNIGRRDVSNTKNASSFHEEIWVSDEGFLKIFDFPLIEGNRSTALQEPYSIILTEETASRLFGNTPAINQMLQLSYYDVPFKVTGVLKNFPTNSHLGFNLMISEGTFKRESEYTEFINKDWTSNGFLTYIQLKPEASVNGLESKLNKLVSENRKDEQSGKSSFWLQPLTAIHFYSTDIEGGSAKTGDVTYMYIFSVIGCFVLFIACINYMNLTTARSASRAKEVGIRKVVGAQRSNLISQFLAEALLITFVSLFLAIVSVQLLLPFFNAFTEKELTLNLGTDYRIWAGIIAVTLTVGMLAGSYPAFFLSRYQPYQVLKGIISQDRGNISLRRILVVFQFTLSIVMIIATLLVYFQLDYVRSKNLGFSKEQLVIVDINSGKVRKSAEVIKSEFSKLAQVKSVAVSSRVPGEWKGIPQVQVKLQGSSLKEGTDMYFVGVDENFISTTGIALAQGRNFNSASLADSTSIIVNETAALALGITQLGEQLVEIPSIAENGSHNLLDKPFKVHVIGIVKDFHFQSLRQTIAPMILAYANNPIHSIDYFTVRLTGNDIPATLKQVEVVLQQVDPTHLLEYHFLDEQLDLFYREDVRREKIFMAAALATIFIACLGLFGLAAFTAQQRTKEIGIRKVLGASVRNIILLLSKDFLRLVFISIVIASPLAWYAMYQWLQDFAYRIPISPWVFILAGTVALAIALLTISFQSIKAALANPVKSLRSE